MNNNAVTVKYFLDLGITDNKDIQERIKINYNTIKYNIGKFRKTGRTEHLPGGSKLGKIEQIRTVDINIFLKSPELPVLIESKNLPIFYFLSHFRPL